AADRAVPQRPARGQLPGGAGRHRWRGGPDRRLRVLREQRPLLRAGQRLERGDAPPGAARRARRRLLRPGAAGPGGPSAAVRAHVAVRLDALGLDHGRLQLPGLRLLGVGNAEVRACGRHVRRVGVREPARRRGRRGGPTLTAAVIGITAALERSRHGVWERDAVLLPRTYVDIVLAAGGVPVLLPPTPDAARAVDRVDAVLLSGGRDVAPDRYGASPHPA